MLVSVWISTAWLSDSPAMLFGPVLGSRRLDCVGLMKELLDIWALVGPTNVVQREGDQSVEDL